MHGHMRQHDPDNEAFNKNTKGNTISLLASNLYFNKHRPLLVSKLML